MDKNLCEICKDKDKVAIVVVGIVVGWSWGEAKVEQVRVCRDCRRGVR